MKRLFLVSILGLALLNGFTGCSGHTVNENDPASMMADAESDIKGDHLQMAIEKLRTIRNKFPYSKYSVDAQLRLADVYFIQDSFVEAAANYESFADLHPKNEKVPYALFRAAKSYFNDVPSTVARDMTSAQKATDAYAVFLRRFPQDANAEEARKDMASLRKQLAEKELYVGNFYFRQGMGEAAAPRFQKVTELYPETDAAKEAREKLVTIEKKKTEQGK